MLDKHESEFICDMAEYYHIYNYHKFNPGYLAILLDGLRDDSRVRMASSGLNVNIDRMLLATIADELGVILGGKKEISLLELLLYGVPEEEKPCLSFESKEGFAEWWNSH